MGTRLFLSQLIRLCKLSAALIFYEPFGATARKAALQSRSSSIWLSSASLLRAHSAGKTISEPGSDKRNSQLLDMWRLRMAIRLLERLLERHHAELAELNIDDDVQMALQPLRRAAAKL